MTFFGELLAFLKTRKKLWLLPLLVIVLSVGTLLLVVQGSVIAPFIYALF